MILYNGIPNFQKIHTNYDYNISLWWKNIKNPEIKCINPEISTLTK